MKKYKYVDTETRFDDVPVYLSTLHGAKMKTQAEIVIIGGGLYGARVAYHLAQN